MPDYSRTGKVLAKMKIKWSNVRAKIRIQKKDEVPDTARKEKGHQHLMDKGYEMWCDHNMDLHQQSTNNNNIYTYIHISIEKCDEA